MFISSIILFLLSHSAAANGKEDPGEQLNGTFENVGL